MATRFMNKGTIDGIYRDHMFSVGKNVVFKDVREEEEKGLVKNLVKNNVSCSDESSSSSIGKNSDVSENSMEIKSGDTGEEKEVQSSYKGPLDAMEALEEVLPIRRGISAFYNGKSKSFASLAEASSSSSIKELAKPENANMRKRRNLLACKRISSMRSYGGGGISKRITSSSSRSTLAFVVAMNNSNIDKKEDVEFNNSTGSLISVSDRMKDFSSWRSFSLADLQHCAAATRSNLSREAMNPS